MRSWTFIAARHLDREVRRPDAAPRRGVTPAAVMPHETAYVGQNRWTCYTEAKSSAIKTVSDLDAHEEWERDPLRQRVRFFDEAFIATYRDQTEPGTTESFADEIFDAIEPSQNIFGSGTS